MSLNNESGSSMSFEELVNLNGEAMAVLDEVPYQPVVYAVPKEWLGSWMTLLENAVRFQPTLYRQLTTLATQEEQQKLQVQLKADLEVAKREMLGELTADLPSKWAGLSFANCRRKVFPVTKSGRQTGTKYSLSKSMPPRVNLIFCLYLCLTA